jgi:glycosyltransferase involved in cell wall biosynthesis
VSRELAVAIPAHNEAKVIGRCLESVIRSSERAGIVPDIVVALNRCTDATQQIAESLGARCVVEDARSIAAVRNAAVRASSAGAIATIDADSWMRPDTVSRVLERVLDTRYVGGGSMVWAERMSVGIFFSCLAVAPYVLASGVSAGLFWFRREDFEAIGGFDERMPSVEDLDFARRLKSHGKARGMEFGTNWRGGIWTSCRKFDRFGDWYLFLNPGFVRRVFAGEREATDRFYYDFER